MKKITAHIAVAMDISKNKSVFPLTIEIMFIIRFGTDIIKRIGIIRMSSKMPLTDRGSPLRGLGILGKIL
ncbi:MAG: hypothetical protein LBL49_09610 [Clostridiales Family XIII bacterium]|nr:hypothetical protein [Clostridiales Family XIII bacterium]